MSEAVRSSLKNEIQALEQQIGELTRKLHVLQRRTTGAEVPNYSFTTQSGSITLLELFANHDQLLMIHNMGHSCRYCTLWADGFNGLLPHLESALAVVLTSQDTPEVQHRFSKNRGWRFRLVSHGGGGYIREQSTQAGEDNMPGAVVYQREGDRVLRRNSAVFGPGDQYCSLWNLLGLAGIGETDWQPQFYYGLPTERSEGDNVHTSS